MDDVTDATIESIAERGRGTPRIANRYVKTLRDYATTGRDISQKSDCDMIFQAF